MVLRIGFSQRWLPIFSAITGVLMLTCLAYMNTIPNPPLSSLQLTLFYLGVGFTIWGAAGGRLGIKGSPHYQTDLSRREWLALIGILILALGLRLWRLDDSIRVLVDELNPINEILHLWDNLNLPILQPIQPYSPFSRLFASWQAGAASVVGHNLLALRLPSALVGTLTVAAVYGLGRVRFNPQIALIAALLMATFPPHVHFSRIGALNVADGLFGALAVLFIAWTVRSNQRAAWVLGGVALGLTQYFHEGGRLLFPVLIIIWMIFKFIRSPHSFRQLRLGLLAAALTAVVIAAPVYFTLGQLNEPATSRMSQNVLDGDYWYAILTSRPGTELFDWLIRHITNPFLLFVSRPDTSLFYGGDQPLILAVLVPAFLSGLVGSLRSSGGRILLLWFMLTWLGNLLLGDSALASRYAVVLPAVVLLMAVGVHQLSTFLPPAHRFKIVVAYVLMCGVIQVGYYSGPHLEVFNRQIRLGERDAYDAILRAADLPPDTQVYLIQPPPSMTERYVQTFLRYLNDDVQIHFVDEVQSLNWESLQRQRVAFFVPASDEFAVDVLSSHFALAPPLHTPYSIPAESYDLYLPVPTKSS